MTKRILFLTSLLFLTVFASSATLRVKYERENDAALQAAVLGRYIPGIFPALPLTPPPPPPPPTHTPPPSIGGAEPAVLTGVTPLIPPSDAGWTVFAKSADTRTVYVSASGNDAWDGLSPEFAGGTKGPKRTVAAGIALLRTGYPDWLLLKRGDVFVNQSLGSWNKSGRSETELMLVSSYGDSPMRPLLQTGTGNGMFVGGTVNNLAVVGLHFTPHLYTGVGSGSKGVYFLGRGSHILFEDCEFESYATNLVFQAFPYGVNRHTDFKLRRSVVRNAYGASSVGHSQGIYAAEVDGLLIEENVFYHNGWSDTLGGADIFRHNIYIDNGNTDVVVRGNISASASSHGIQLRPGGVLENNLFVRNSIAAALGGGNHPEPGGTTIQARNNVILDGKNITSTLPRGWGFYIANISSGTVANNIISSNVLGSQPLAMQFDGLHKGEDGVIDSGVSNLAVTGNVIYNWGGSVFVVGDPPQIQDITFSGNDYQNPAVVDQLIDHANAANIPEFHASGNRFFSAAPDAGATKWTSIGGALQTLSVWKSQIGDTTSTQGLAAYPGPSRSVATYHATLGGIPTFEAFMAEAVKQSKANWRPEYMAAAVNAYIRAGFGK